MDEPQAQHVELRRRDPDEALLHAASTVAAQKRELAEIRALLDMPADASHEQVLGELRNISAFAAELVRLAVAHLHPRRG